MSTTYSLAAPSWDHLEHDAMQEVVNSGAFTMGEKVRAFEEKFAQRFGSKYAVMVNSGSSANLLAVAALRYTQNNPLHPGDEVIVPAVSWSTTYFPLHQYGLEMRFVDIDKNTLNIDLQSLEKAITPKTKAIFGVNLLGSPNDFTTLQRICSEHNLSLIEDNCESMGASFEGKPCGSFGRLGTFSLFFSHHICTIEGGMVITDEEELYHILLSLRSHGWTRHLPKDNHLENKTGDPFEDAFRFVLPGYNLRPCELNGALGLEQLDKLDTFLAARHRNAQIFREAFHVDHFPHIRIQKPVGESSWFGFAITLAPPLSGKRRQITRGLMSAGIECRPIVAGNFARNPVVQHLKHTIYGDLTIADTIHRDGFFVGNHHYDLSGEITHLRSVLEKLVVEV